tara:strand:+ start:2115 stop:3377 length:1263 start_codon:yes stop_codon:yes gene_type:complete
MDKRVCVIGLGYIGLPTAAFLADSGYDVIGVDIDKEVVEIINKGNIHIIEPKLDSLVKDVVSKKKLVASLNPAKSDVYIIAVPTPFHETSKEDIPKPNIDYVKDAVISISSFLKKGDLVILESTSPIGTTEHIRDILKELREDLNFEDGTSNDCDVNIAYCPERVIPGNVLYELKNNDRVLGGITNECSEKASQFYKNFINGKCFKTNSKTAEMTKLVENSSRDVQIAFANELSIICENLDINVWELISLANHHPRVNILNPGPGVGGHCIAVDPWFIVDADKSNSRIIRQARQINDSKPFWVIERIKEEISRVIDSNELDAQDITICIYGLTFKPDVDDIRESPALQIAEEILRINKGKIFFVDPNLKNVFLNNKEYKITGLNDLKDYIHIHLLLVDHKEFKDFKPKNGSIIDTRGIWQ